MNFLCLYRAVEGIHMRALPQGKVARAYRIGGAIVLYPLAGRSLSMQERPHLHADPRWSMVFAFPLFLRTLFRLVFFCPHRHKGPPITPRESIPSRLSLCRPFNSGGTYITCLDCGQKFAYNHKTRQLVDFWGIHDTAALAGLRRKFERLISPFRGLAAGVGTLNTGIPINVLVESVDRLAILTRSQWNKTRRLIGSK
jgi:hypothetical protein